jgi:hypothetical protein
MLDSNQPAGTLNDEYKLTLYIVIFAVTTVKVRLV